MNFNALYNTEITIQIQDSAIVIGFRPKAIATRFQFFNPEGEPITMFTMRYNQEVEVSIKPVDAAGNDAPVDGVPEWSLSSSDFAHIKSTTPDGLKSVIAGDKPGSFQVNVTGDADLGTGVIPIVSMLDMTLQPGQATGFEMQTGTPTDQAPATTKKSK